MDSFIARYIAMWHEADRARRHALVASLWAEDAENITRTFTVRGISEILARVDRAHDEWVAKRDFVFRPAGHTDGHNNLIRFHWEMLPRGGGALEARGLDIFVLGGDGLIQSLYQLADPLRPA
jgi:hypothetical protein